MSRGRSAREAWRLGPAVIAALLLAGCYALAARALKGDQLYPGPRRPESETALLRGRVHRIGDQALLPHGELGVTTGMRAMSVGWEVLPGRHTVIVQSSYPHAAKWIAENTLEFEAKAGLVYIAAWWPDGPPMIHEHPRSIPLGRGVPVGRVVGTAQKLPDAAEGRSATWKVAVKVAGLTTPLPADPERQHDALRDLVNRLEPEATALVFHDRDAGSRGGEPFLRGLGAYGLVVKLDTQYVGPEGNVPAPGVWLVGSGGVVLRKWSYSRGALRADTLRWLFSYDAPPRRVQAGEAFADLWYSFRVPESITPDQFRLAFADVPPLRLPAVQVAP